MLRVQPFTPGALRSTVSLAVTATSKTVKFDNVLGVGKNQSVRLFNAGPSLVYLEFVGDGGDQTATSSNSMPLASGASERFSTAGCTVIAAVCAAGQSSTLYVTPGEGL